MNQSLLQRAVNYYRDRNRREQYFIIAGGVIMYSLVVFVVVMTFNSNISEVRSEVDGYETALETLTTVAPTYLKQQSQGGGNDNLQQFSDDKLVGNDIQLTSFVARHATEADFTFDSYDKNERQLGSQSDDNGGPQVTKTDQTADIREVEFAKLIALLKSIEETDKPVYVSRVRLNQHRNQPGMVQATVYVTTFRIPKSS